MQDDGKQLESMRKKLEDACDGVDLNKDEGRWTALLCGNMLSAIWQHQTQGIQFLAGSYHQLKDDTETEMVKIRQFCEIDQTRSCSLPAADSQSKSGLSRESLRLYHRDISSKQVLVMNSIMEKCGFPTCERFPHSADKMTTEVLGFPPFNFQHSDGDSAADSSSGDDRPSSQIN